MKILLVRVSSLGDVLHNLPMVADLLRHYPGAEIDWVVEEAYTGLVRLNPGVRRIIPFALRRWRKSLMHAATRAEIRAFLRELRSQAYDLVLDTQGLMKTGLVMGLARLAPGGKKVGLGNGTEGSGYEGISRIFHHESVRVDRHCHAVMRGRLVAAAACDYTIQEAADFGLQAPALTPAWLPATPYAVFFHGSAGAAKKWPLAHWIEIGHTLAERGLTLLLPWGNAAEQAEANALAAALPNARVLPALPLPEAVVLAQRAALAIGVDTGLTHIAAAFTTPTIEIYCASPRWKTEGNWSDKIINLGDNGQPATVGEVEQAIRRLLGDSGLAAHRRQ